MAVACCLLDSGSQGNAPGCGPPCSAWNATTCGPICRAIASTPLSTVIQSGSDTSPSVMGGILDPNSPIPAEALECSLLHSVRPDTIHAWIHSSSGHSTAGFTPRLEFISHNLRILVGVVVASFDTFSLHPSTFSLRDEGERKEGLELLNSLALPPPQPVQCLFQCVSVCCMCTHIATAPLLTSPLKMTMITPYLTLLPTSLSGCPSFAHGCGCEAHTGYLAGGRWLCEWMWWWWFPDSCSLRVCTAVVGRAPQL